MRQALYKLSKEQFHFIFYENKKGEESASVKPSIMSVQFSLAGKRLRAFITMELSASIKDYPPLLFRVNITNLIATLRVSKNRVSPF